MSRSTFYIHEKAALERLRVLQYLVAKQATHDEPCPLLAAQLNEMGVLCRRLQEHIDAMAGYVSQAHADFPPGSGTQSTDQ